MLQNWILLVMIDRNNRSQLAFITLGDQALKSAISDCKIIELGNYQNKTWKLFFFQIYRNRLSPSLCEVFLRKYAVIQMYIFSWTNVYKQKKMLS